MNGLHPSPNKGKGRGASYHFWRTVLCHTLNDAIGNVSTMLAVRLDWTDVSVAGWPMMLLQASRAGIMDTVTRWRIVY
jgi:hypothetical protein